MAAQSRNGLTSQMALQVHAVVKQSQDFNELLVFGLARLNTTKCRPFFPFRATRR
jgi:hypothetical protein